MARAAIAAGHTSAVTLKWARDAGRGTQALLHQDDVAVTTLWWSIQPVTYVTLSARWHPQLGCAAQTHSQLHLHTVTQWAVLQQLLECCCCQRAPADPALTHKHNNSLRGASRDGKEGAEAAAQQEVSLGLRDPWLTSGQLLCTVSTCGSRAPLAPTGKVSSITHATLTNKTQCL